MNRIQLDPEKPEIFEEFLSTRYLMPGNWYTTFVDGKELPESRHFYNGSEWILIESAKLLTIEEVREMSPYSLV